jgi:hypothetical protein
MHFFAKSSVLFCLVCLFPLLSQAQQISQTVKGIVMDKAVRSPLIGATIELLNAGEVRGTVTDVDGRFRLENVPVGKCTLRINYLGYREIFMPNVTVNSGKEVDLNIEMEESVIIADEVVVKAQRERQQALNEMSTVSARSFSVNETQRFAAALNDPARMAQSYAGVISGGDNSNALSIRGNGPNGLLWRMEGVDIPNPNHFSSVGSSGGGISILSAQLLSNSDFMSGAFAAEYGNALSGVFDLRLRRGNTDRNEFTFQLGALGIDAATEGPIKLGKNKGSFLVNYRYSTLSVLSRLGLEIGDAQTDFQDLSFNLYLPTGKAGTFTLFGFGGISNQFEKPVADSLLWKKDGDKRFGYEFGSNSGAVGLTHSKIWGNTHLKTVLAASGTLNKEFDERFERDYSKLRTYNDNFEQNRFTLSSVLSHKFDRKNFLRLGAYANLAGFDLVQQRWNFQQRKLEERLKQAGDMSWVDAFAQWQYRMNEKLTFNAGFHTLAFGLTKQVSFEPRAALKYSFSGKTSLSMGYGRHSQVQPIGLYFNKNITNGQVFNPDLGMSKADHYVLSFDQYLPRNYHVKAEVYYQHLFDVPVSRGAATSFSILNQRDGFVYGALENTGLGRNYGLELTFEKSLTNGLYFILATSLYNSEYRASDLKWRNTRFNTNYATAFTAGKEWPWERNGKKRSFALNLRVTSVGGYREAPINLAESAKQKTTIRDNVKAFEAQLPAYFRADIGMRIIRNYKKLTTTFALDIQNATNNKNVFSQYYSVSKGKIDYDYMLPLIPVLAYKLEF